MKTTNGKFVGWLVMIVAAFLLNGCGPDVDHIIIVEMRNNSSEAIHLWCSGEDIGPSNKVEPGASRTNTIPWTQRDGDIVVEQWPVTVSAGSGGVVLTSKVFQVEVQKTAGIRVSYSGGGLTQVK